MKGGEVEGWKKGGVSGKGERARQAFHKSSIIAANFLITVVHYKIVIYLITLITMYVLEMLY